MHVALSFTAGSSFARICAIPTGECPILCLAGRVQLACPLAPLRRPRRVKRYAGACVPGEELSLVGCLLCLPLSLTYPCDVRYRPLRLGSRETNELQSPPQLTGCVPTNVHPSTSRNELDRIDYGTVPFFSRQSLPFVSYPFFAPMDTFFVA